MANMYNKLNILIIEDFWHDYVLMEKALTRSNELKCTTTCVSHGEKAISLLKTRSYDFVIIDYRLPKKNGLEIFEEIKNAGIQMPVIFIAASGDEYIAARAIKLGAQEYLIKDPLGRYLDILPEVIKKAMIDWKAAQEHKLAIEQLRRSEERYRGFVQNSSEGIWCFETKPIPIELEEEEIIKRIYATATLIECNDTMAQMYGFKKRENIIGTPLKNLLVPTDKRNIEYLKNFIQNGFQLTGGKSYEPDIKGKIHVYLNNLTGIIENGYFVRAWGTQRDITAQEQEQKIRETLFNVSNAINTTENLEELFKVIHKELSNIIDTTNFYIALYDEASNIITAPYYVDQTKKEAPPPQQLRNGLTAYVIRTKKPLYLTVKKREQLMREGKIAKADWKSKIWLCVPLTVKGKVIGAMAVQSYTDPNAYTKDDLKLLEIVSDHIALAISHGRQEEITKLSERKYKDTINSMADAICVVDENLNITLSNEALLNLNKELDLPTDIIGKNLFKVFPFLPAKVQKGYKEVFEKGKTIRTEKTYQFNNRLLTLQIQNAPITQNGKTTQVITVLRDLTKEREAEKKYITQLQNLLDIGMSMHRELHINELLQKISNIIIKSLGWRQVIISLRDYEAGTSRPVAMAGYEKEKAEEILNFPPSPIEKTERFIRDEFKISRSYFIDHTHWEELQAYPAPLVITPVEDLKQGGWDEHDVLFIPIQGKDKILGFISPDNPVDGKKPSLETVEALEVFADLAGVAIENAQLYEKIEYSENRLKNVLANIGEWVWETDQEGRFVFSSYIIEEILGYKSEEVIEKYFYEIFPKEEKATLMRLYNHIIKRKRSFRNFIILTQDKNGEKVILKLNGIPLIDSKGNLTGYRGSARDITIEKTTQDKLKESEEKYKTLINSALDGIYMHDLDGNFMLVNPAICKVLGYSEKEFLNMNISDILTPEGLKLAKEKTEYKMRTRKPTPLYEFSLISKEGTIIPVEINSAPIIRNEKVVAIQGIARDMREQKRVEKRIRESLQEKEVLLREIHHRVKNNMQIIMSLLRLQSRTIEDARIKELFKESEERVRSMALVHEMLYQSDTLAKINIKRYIESLVGHILSTFPVRVVKVNINVEENIFLDINKAIPLSLLTNELVSNAAKHAFPEGRKGNIWIELYSLKDNKYKLTVADDGIGIPDNLVPDKSESLGFQLVTILTEQLKGNLILDRKDGTKFTITFP